MDKQKRAPILRHEAIDVELGDRIRVRRKMAGVSQTKLGTMIGLTFQQIQKYEKGANRVAVSTLIMICDALGIELMDLLEGLGSNHEFSAQRENLLSRLHDAEQRLGQIREICR